MRNLVKNDEQLVIYDNRINVSLQGLKARDYDTFMLCAYKLKDRKNEQIEISYTDLINASQSKHYTINELHEYLKNGENITSVRVCYEDKDGNIEKAPIFKRFSANKQRKVLTLKVNDEFIDLFSELTHNFTTLDLVRYTGLKSKYSKIMYQNLCQYRNKKTKSGFWSIPLEDSFSDTQPVGFKTIFDVPQAYLTKRILDKIIKPAINELKPYMQIDCTTILKGRKTIGYRFDFKEIEQKVIEKKPEPKVSDDQPSTDTGDIMDKILDIIDASNLSLGVKSAVACAKKAIELNRDIEYINDVVNITKSQSCDNAGGKLMSLIVHGYDKPKSTNKTKFIERNTDKQELNELEKLILQRNLG